MRFNINTNYWNFQKATYNNLPSSTVFLDISKEPEALLSGMKPKTRYNIRLSQKKDLQIHSIGLENINIWYELYRETAARNRLYLNNIEYFEAVLKAKTQQAQTAVQLLLAEWQGKALAALFLVISGDRGSYLYSLLFGHRTLCPLMPCNGSHQTFQTTGCTQYDRFVLHPVLIPPTRFMACTNLKPASAEKFTTVWVAGIIPWIRRNTSFSRLPS
jgi:hypothetical protein